MARKGNQQKNGVACRKPAKKYTGPESGEARVSAKEKILLHDQEAVDEDLTNGDKICNSTDCMGENHNTMNNGNKNKQQTGNVTLPENLFDRTLNSAHPVEVRDATGGEGLSDASASREGDGTSLGSNHRLRSFRRGRHQGLSLEKLKGYSATSVKVVGRSLGPLNSFILKAVNGWMEQQKPKVTVLTNAIHGACDYICAKLKHISPIFWARILQFGNLMILLFVVCLDCNLRGFNSLLRLGTTSLFTVIWCSIFSISAMIGITKMLIIVVVAALLGFFVGFALAVLLVSLCSTIILWFYGSFWITGFAVLLGGITFALRHERVALFITTVYAIYCAKSYVGWIGLVLGLNFSFISSDVLVLVLKNSINEHEANGPPEQPDQNQRLDQFYGEHFYSSSADDAFQTEFARSADRGPADPSTSGTEAELTSENEVARLLNCNDHYAAFGLARYENVDISILKREYRKRAMLVHPDKNMGNEKAADAFKKLQNAYEVLLDSLKRKTYDDELRREEILNYFRRFQGSLPKNGRRGFFSSVFTHSASEGEGSHGESRRIACKKCNDFHIWTRVERSKSQARWCQDCTDFHQAKDGDGWVEQLFHPLLFGLLQKMEAPCAYVCAESRIYDATEWFICQGMRCPANSHKPSFHVNTSVMSKENSSKGASSSHRGTGASPFANMDEPLTEEELFEWLQNVMQSGIFEDGSIPSHESPPPRTGGSSSKSNVKKKRKGKKQW